MQYHIQTLRVRADFSGMQVPETCSYSCGKLAYLPLWPHQTRRGEMDGTLEASPAYYTSGLQVRGPGPRWGISL